MESNNTTNSIITNSSTNTVWYWFRICFISLTVVAEVFGNIICLITISRLKSVSKNNRFLMTVISVSDLGTGIVLSLSIAPSITGFWLYGVKEFCIAFELLFAFLIINVLTLMLASLDRYIAMTRPLRHKMLVTKRRLVIVVSVYSSLMMIAVFLDNSRGLSTVFDSNLCICRQIRDTSGLQLQALGDAVAQLVILSFIVFVYGRLLHIARASIKENQQNQSRNISSDSKRNNLKAVQIFAVFTMTFTCAWVPKIIYSIYNSVTGKDAHYVIEFLVFWFSFSGAWWDVASLVLVNPTFRKAMLNTIVPSFIVKEQSHGQDDSKDHQSTVISQVSTNI